MPDNIRALIVVLAFAVPTFYLGRQLSISVITSREFAMWRNAWLGATLVAFLSSSYLVFAVTVIMVCVYARVSRAATVALFFVLMFAVPLGRVPIYGFGLVNLLFVIDNGRLLSIVLLFPILFMAGRSSRLNGRTFVLPDRLIIAYVLLRFGLDVQRSEVTQFLRSGLVLTLDVLIPYFAFSRTITSTADLHRVSLAVIVAVLPLSLIGVFETVKGWLLYSTIVNNWSDLPVNYLRRDGILRAIASTATPIVLGFVIMVAIGQVIAVRRTIRSQTFTGITFAILAVGLIATVSRGPWVGAVVLIVVYLALSHNAVTNLARLVVVGFLISIPLLLTPIGERLFDMLPFIGSSDIGSLTYRQRLFDNSILVIQRNPWFGSADYLLTPEMQEMIQGEHIVDIVNTYLKITLDSGLVGLSLFLGFFSAILVGLWRVLKFGARHNRGLSTYSRASMATLGAILVTIGTVSSIDFIPWVYWSFAGLCVAIIRIVHRERAALAPGVSSAAA